jgi:hypothetical protein
MIPSSARAIPGSIEPSLVTRHRKSFVTGKCGRITVFLAIAIIKKHTGQKQHGDSEWTWQLSLHQLQVLKKVNHAGHD